MCGKKNEFFVFYKIRNICALFKFVLILNTENLDYWLEIVTFNKSLYRYCYIKRNILLQSYSSKNVGTLLRPKHTFLKY